MKKNIKKLLAPIILEVMQETITESVRRAILIADKLQISVSEKNIDDNKDIATKFLKSDFKELDAKINQVRLPNPNIGYMTIRSSLEVLLDMAVYQSQLSKHKAPPSKEEFLKHCTDRLSFSYDALIQHCQSIRKNQSE